MDREEMTKATESTASGEMHQYVQILVLILRFAGSCRGI